MSTHQLSRISKKYIGYAASSRPVADGNGLDVEEVRRGGCTLNEPQLRSALPWLTPPPQSRPPIG